MGPEDCEAECECLRYTGDYLVATGKIDWSVDETGRFGWDPTDVGPGHCEPRCLADSDCGDQGKFCAPATYGESGACVSTDYRDVAEGGFCGSIFENLAAVVCQSGLSCLRILSDEYYPEVAVCLRRCDIKECPAGQQCTPLAADELLPAAGAGTGAVCGICVHRTGMKTLGEECDESQPEECQIGSDCSSAAGEPK